MRVVVVGSGLLGACLARALVEHGHDVIIVERGAAVTEPPGSHLRDTEAFARRPDTYFADIGPYLEGPGGQPDPSLPAAGVTSAVGGQGILWTNNCPRSVPEVERWPGISDEEWERLYVVAERYLSVRPARGSRRGVRIGECLRAHLRDRAVQEQPFAGRFPAPGRIEYVAVADILAPVIDAVEIRRAQAERLHMEAARVVGVELAEGSLDADAVVLAAGALETPMLLWASGLRLPALGRWLTYHEVLVTQLVLDDELMDGVDADDDPPRLMIRPDTGHPWHIMVLRDTNPLTPRHPDVDIDPRRLVEIQAFCPIDPDHANRIDPATGGFQVVRSTADEQRQTAMERDVSALIATMGRARSGCEPTWLPSGAHVMGTCRMGEDAASSVADLHGRVHGTHDLWLASVGLIPTRFAVNPTLTGAALAIRTAAALAA